MTVFAEKKYFSVDEYLRIQEASLEKLEYYDGKIKPMSGGTFNHNAIAARILVAISNALEKTGGNYFVLGSDMKIQIEKENKFLYPDTLVICGKPAFYKNRKDTITNPILIVEVLSKSTQKKDQTEKFESYKTLSSFQEYVIVSQDTIGVKTFLRKENWKSTSFNNITDSILLKSIGVEISMEDIFDGIDFSE